jgi:gliding motility-associated-like protein
MDMKKQIINRVKAIAFLVLLLSTSLANAQIGNFTLSVQNLVQTAPGTLEFDVYLLDTDPGQPFEFATSQFGFLLNSGIYTGGSLSVAINNAGSGLNASQQFVALPSLVSAVTGYPNQALLRLIGQLPPAPGAGTIISTVAPGTKMTHFILTSTVNFVANSTPDIVFLSNTVVTPLYATRVSQFQGVTAIQLPVTPSINAIVNGNPVLNPPSTAPAAFAVTGGGSYCQGNAGLPVGLVNSESGVTYTLLKDGLAQVPTMDGTGAAISFGNRLAGTYTISGNNSGGATAMTGSAVITENAQPAVPSVSLVQPSCTIATGTITVTAPTEAGMTYSIDGITYTNTTGVFNSVVSGSYSVTAKSSSGCVSTATIVTLNSGSVIPVLTTSSAATICSGTSTSINLTASVPSNFTWTIGAVTGGITGAVAGSGATINQVLTLPGTSSTGTVEYIVTPVSVAGSCTGTPSSIIVTVNASPVASISIVASSNHVCEANTVFFTATPLNGGSTPEYLWKVNGLNVGGNSSTYSYIPLNNDVINCVLTSNASCVSVATATSNAVTMVVDPASVGGSVTGTTLPVTFGITTGTMMLSGHTGTVVKWQKMFGTGTWTDIANTALTFSEVPSAMGIWMYRAVVMNGTCSQAFSSALTVNVIQKAIVITPVSAQSKVYGSADPVFSYTSSPALEPGDSFTGVLGRIAGTNTGTYSYTLGSLSAGSNYTLTLGGTSTFSITPKAIVVTADAGQTKIYGQSDPVFTYTNTPALESGDSFTGALGRVSGADVGNYAYTIGTLSAGTNYTLTMGGTSAFSIVSKSVVITPNAGQTKVYGQADPAFTFTNTPALDAGDSFTGALARVSGTNTGSYGFVLGTLSAGNNYNLTMGGTSTFSITPKPIVVTANSGQTKVYGDSDPSTFSYTFAPALEGSDVITGNISRSPGETVGNYLYTMGSLDASPNYSLSMVGSNPFIITAKSVTVTGVAANSKLYDGTTSALINSGSANLNGLITGDVVTLNTTGASGAFDDKNAGTGKTVTITGMTISGADALNYNLLQPVSAADITQASLSIAGVTSDNRVYNGTTVATLNTTSALLAGVLGSDAVTLNSTSATGIFADKHVGTGKVVTVTGFTLSGTDAGNYTLAQPAITADITQKALTLTCSNLSKIYGTALTLSGNDYTATGLVSGDVLTGVTLTSAGSAATADAGSYAVSATGGNNANYSITYVAGTLTVNKADQAITFADLPTGMRMTQEHILGAVSTSGLPIVYSVSDPSVASVSGNILTVSKEGSASIIASQAGNNNWNAAVDVSKVLTSLPTFDNITSLFSPNGDGMNDYWYIPDLDKYGTVQVVVYNRFGKAVYESSSYKNDWDGTMNGNPLPSATYYYMIKSSQRGTIYGPVNIVR